MSKLISSREAAKILNISIRRVQVLIETGRIPAEKIGGSYVIKEKDLDTVRTRTIGRPKKAK